MRFTFYVRCVAGAIYRKRKQSPAISVLLDYKMLSLFKTGNSKAPIKRARNSLALRTHEARRGCACIYIYIRKCPFEPFRFNTVLLVFIIKNLNLW